MTIEALNNKGVQPVKLGTGLRGLKIEGPTQLYVVNAAPIDYRRGG